MPLQNIPKPAKIWSFIALSKMVRLGAARKICGLIKLTRIQPALRSCEAVGGKAGCRLFQGWMNPWRSSMKYKDHLFKNRKFDFKKLENFGFRLHAEKYVYKTNIFDDTFELTVEISPDETIDTKLIEISTGEEYNLIYVSGAEGEFVGKVKSEFENVLLEIKEKCTFFNAFKTEYANLIIKYIKEKYGDEAEYLWEKFPNNAVFRKKDNSKTGGKWYGAILSAKRASVGIDGNGEIEIIDLKGEPEKIDKLVDNKRYFRGYHMNKKHWYTIPLDGTVPLEEIKSQIDESYKTL